MTRWSFVGSLFVIVGSLFVGAVDAQENPTTIEIGEGKFTLVAPAKWLKKKPRTNIVEHEFEIPAAEGDDTAGRLTVMASGGTVDDNVARWLGQFTVGGKALTKDKARIEKLSIADMTVHYVDMAGTYKDQKGPFAPAEMKAGYRMLGAIVESADIGNYYLKFYGPNLTVEANKEAFQEFMNSLKAK